jgi:hypothetical protein
MAVIGNGAYTFADLANQLRDGGAPNPTIEILAQANPILDDIPWVQGNLPTGHKTTMRTSLPTGTWRILNSGALLGKSTTTVITETAAILEGYNQIDRDLASIGGNAAAFRASEDRAFVEGFSQQMAQTLFYGNTAVTPGSFLGLSPRYGSTGTTGSAGAAGGQVIDAGGTGTDNASIWLIGWSEQTVHGFYPQGSVGGIQVNDVSTDAPVSDGAGGFYQVFMTKFQWKCGMAVRDWRYIVRIANIDVSDLAGATPPNLIRLMIRALSMVEGLGGNVQWRFYAPRAALSWLRDQITNANNVWLTTAEVAGRPVTQFGGVTVRPMDQLLTTESRVTAAT